MSAELTLLAGLMLITGGAGLVWAALHGRAAPRRRSPIVQNRRGELIFFPWGRRGRGYVLPGPQAAERIQRFRAVYLIALLLLLPILWPLAEAAGSAAGLLLALGLLAAYGLGYGLFVWRTVRRLPAWPEPYEDAHG